MAEKVVTLTLPKEFAAFLESVHRQHPTTVDSINGQILTLDPGETTGWCFFDGDVTLTVSQQETKFIGPSYEWLSDKLLNMAFSATEVAPHLRYEDYRVYEWKTADHAWSPVHTLRWIGAIEVAAYLAGIPISFCMASFAKNFWTDEKLKHFGLYPSGLRHGKDALRHMLYYMLFPTKVNE